MLNENLLLQELKSPAPQLDLIQTKYWVEGVRPVNVIVVPVTPVTVGVDVAVGGTLLVLTKISYPFAGADVDAVQSTDAAVVVIFVIVILAGTRHVGGDQVYVRPGVGIPAGLAVVLKDCPLELAVPAVELVKATVLGFVLLLKSAFVAPRSPI